MAEDERTVYNEEDDDGEDIADTEGEEDDEDTGSSDDDDDDEDDEEDEEDDDADVVGTDEDEVSEGEDEEDDENDLPALCDVLDRVRRAKEGDAAWFAAEFDKRVRRFEGLEALAEPRGYRIGTEIQLGSRKCALSGHSADTVLELLKEGPPGPKRDAAVAARVFIKKRYLDLFAHIYTLACFSHKEYVEYELTSADKLARWFINAASVVDAFAEGREAR